MASTSHQAMSWPSPSRWGTQSWPDEVAPRGRRTSSTRNIQPQTSNLSLGYPVVKGSIHVPLNQI